MAAWPAASWPEAAEEDKDELDAGRRARQAKREELRLRQEGVAPAKPSGTAARTAARAAVPPAADDEPGAAVTAVASASAAAAPGAKGKRAAKPSAENGAVGASSNACERCGKSFQNPRGLRTHKNFCKDERAGGPRQPATAQPASTALVARLPASVALRSELAGRQPGDEISQEPDVLLLLATTTTYYYYYYLPLLLPEVVLLTTTTYHYYLPLLLTTTTTYCYYHSLLLTTS